MGVVSECCCKEVYIYMIDILIIIGEQSEPHTYRTAEKNLRHIYIYIYMFFIYI